MESRIEFLLTKDEYLKKRTPMLVTIFGPGGFDSYVSIWLSPRQVQEIRREFDLTTTGENDLFETVNLKRKSHEPADTGH